MTPAEAAALHARASPGDAYVMWFVTLSDPAHPGKAVAWAMVADTHGCKRAPGELTASTISEARAMLPAGLVRRDRTPFMPDGVVERWRGGIELGRVRQPACSPRDVGCGSAGRLDTRVSRLELQ